jgi:lysyl oxidase
MWKLLPGAFLGALLLAGAAPAFAQCTPASCDDANPCTDDLCDPTLGCRHFNNNTSCTDGNSCTTNDVCSQGACVGGPAAAGCTACQAAANLPTLGGTFVGTTSGSSTLAGSCGTSGSSPERVYRWIPSSSGVATFQTCGSGTNYDSVVYVRSGSCTGSQRSCNDDGPCATSNSSDQGSRTTTTVTAGQTYYVVVDGWNGRSGTYSLTVQPPSVCGNGVREGAEACDGAASSGCATGQCTAQCTCVPPSQGLPDLKPEITNWSVQRGASVSAGDVAEGCAESTSGVDLLRFGVRVRNEGNADLFFGDPGCPNCSGNPLAACANPNYTCSPAEGHNHPHYSNYARYELLDPSSQAVVIGHKQGFCLLDLECSAPKYSCNYQGITAGCADVYSSDLGCQYLDVTGIAAGNYTLRVTADPFGRISELDETDNVVSTPVTIGAPGADACTNPTVIPAAGGVIDDSTGGASTQSGTCGNTASAPEKVYRWTPSVSGTATIETCGSGTQFDTVVYLRTGTCQGSQSACNDDSCTIANGQNYGSRISPTVTAGQTYFIVVDGYGSSFGNFRLTVTPPSGSPPPPPPPPPTGGACTNPTVIPAAGGQFTGTTSGSSTANGSCGSSGGAPERVFQWTPTRSGTATIQTCGGISTRFDTVLYMRTGNCQTGTQAACNDDTAGCDTFTGGGTGSRITPSVTAGQTYYIFVDGYGSASGNFELTVTAP